MRIRRTFLSLFLLLLFPVASSAQWDVDGVKVSAVSGVQNPTGIIPDGSGGAIIVWQDSRVANSDIYVQRLNAWGVAQWTIDGLAICTATGIQDTPVILPDGAGGAIVAWRDARPGATTDIYAQRINSSGVPQWTADGVVICNATGNQGTPAIVSDGAGGAIVVWADARTDAGDIYAQRINSSGVAQWTANGVAMSATTLDQINPSAIPDGAGGAIATWTDFRSGTSFDVYAQRINASGVNQWNVNGNAICTLSQNQTDIVLCTDGSGGAIITWNDFRSGASQDVYAQRVNAAGSNQWTNQGIVVTTIASNQLYPKIVEDGAGGAYVAWNDYRNVNVDIYAQHIGPAGTVQWAGGGVAVCAQASDQLNVRVTGDGAGGFIMVWQDLRGGSSADIYAQRMNTNAAAQWTADGIRLSGMTGDQLNPIIAADGFGGVMVAWYDMRIGTPDIYAQRADITYGYWGHPEPAVTAVADIPNDQGGKVKVNWKASSRDVPVPATIDFYSVWRAVDVAPSLMAGEAPALTPIDRVTADTAPGTVTTFAASSYYWELVGTQTAYRWPAYSYSASTRADSVLGNSGNMAFMVAAHSVSDDHIAFMSNSMTGHSVDNLAPSAPLYLTAQRAGGDVHLKWNRVRVADLRDYAVYRATSSGVTPIDPNFLESATDTVLVDTSAPTSALYYIVTAYDVHRNQSLPSNEANVSATTGVRDTPAITGLTLLPNHPNPFAGSTELEIGLPAASAVNIEVFDVAGRRVRMESLPRQGAGWQRVPFDGRDDAGKLLSSGVYFCRVTAGSDTITRKIVIAR